LQLTLENDLMNDVLVLGIDPAPAKKTVIFDGKEFIIKDHNELIEYLKDHKNVLICWDAPLTGPHGCKKNVTNAFSQRPIEAFFTRSHKKYDFKVPKGISVMGYSGCPHWAITKSVLGLPIIGKYEQEIKMPFMLITSKEENIIKSVVEVHPAVAIWLWCKEDLPKEMTWLYKSDRVTFGIILEKLATKKIISTEIKNMFDAILEKNKAKIPDDYLDAYIAWYLGNQFLHNTPIHPVALIGNVNTGAWLLPNIDNRLASAFDKFIKENECE